MNLYKEYYKVHEYGNDCECDGLWCLGWINIGCNVSETGRVLVLSKINRIWKELGVGY